MNIIRYTWAEECARRSCLQELEPRFMLYTNKELEAYFSVNIGQYGDHHTQPVDVERLR